MAAPKKLMTGTSLVIGVLDFGKVIWTKTHSSLVPKNPPKRSKNHLRGKSLRNVSETTAVLGGDKKPEPCLSIYPRNFPSSSWSISRLVVFFHLERMVEHIFFLEAQWPIYEGQPPQNIRPNFQQKQGAPFGFQVQIYKGRYTSWDQ